MPIFVTLSTTLTVLPPYLVNRVGYTFDIVTNLAMHKLILERHSNTVNGHCLYFMCR